MRESPSSEASRERPLFCPWGPVFHIPSQKVRLDPPYLQNSVEHITVPEKVTTGSLYRVYRGTRGPPIHSSLTMLRCCATA